MALSSWCDASLWRNPKESSSAAQAILGDQSCDERVRPEGQFPSSPRKRVIGTGRISRHFDNRAADSWRDHGFPPVLPSAGIHHMDSTWKRVQARSNYYCNNASPPLRLSRCDAATVSPARGKPREKRQDDCQPSMANVRRLISSKYDWQGRLQRAHKLSRRVTRVGLSAALGSGGRPGRLRHVGQSGILWQSGVVSREVDSCDTRSAMIQGGMWHDATRDRSYRGAL